MTETGQKAARFIVCLAAALISGMMLASGFAPWENVTAPWAGLVPLLLVCWKRPPRESFGWGFLSGAVTWLTGLSWLTALHRTAHLPLAVAGLGWAALAVYCALYTALFAWAVSRWLQWTGVGNLLRNCASVLVIPAFWVGLEYLRSVLFTGFPWNPLGATQAPNPAIAQSAEWGGVFLVSGIVVLFNTAIAFTICRYLDWRAGKKYRPHVELFMGLAVMAFCTVWGRSRFVATGSLGGNVLIGVVQPAVAQDAKWDEAYAAEVQDRLNTLTFEAKETGQALAGKRPDLIIWPETSTPGDVSQEGEYRTLLSGLAAECGPLLLGTMWEADDGSIRNRSILADTNGVFAAYYDKQHLVPFGEFIPLDKRIPALKRIAPLGISLSPGRVPAVLAVPGTPVRFSVTICFEDIFPGLSREFVRRGARLLVNQSNDAWFDGTAQHRQHLNLGVMRCIENRVPGVRVSNSGATGFIEPNGRVYHTGLARSNEDGWLGAPGPVANESAVSDVSLVDVPGSDQPLTFYTRHGDWVLAIPCAAIVIVWSGAAWRMDRKKTRPDKAPAHADTEGAQA